MVTIIKRDGVEVQRLTRDESALHWFLSQHSYSMDHAIRYEGYSVEELETPRIAPAETMPPESARRRIELMSAAQLLEGIRLIRPDAGHSKNMLASLDLPAAERETWLWLTSTAAERYPVEVQALQEAIWGPLASLTDDELMAVPDEQTPTWRDIAVRVLESVVSA